MRKTLTDAAVKRLKPPEKGQLDVFDQGYPGLALRISYGGRRSWVYFYRIGGRLRRMTLGTYPALSLSEAREAWRSAKEARDKGRDPAADRKRKTGTTDFTNVFEEWLRRDQSGNRSHDAVKRLIEKDAMPAWRDRSVPDIGRRDVLDVLDAVVDRGSPVTARRLHAHLHRFFRWCAQRDIIAANPMTDLPKPGRETRRDRVLSDDELKAVWTATNEMGWPFGPAMKLLILTGARRGEIGGLRWSEVLDAKLHLAGERTKNGEPHSIPLSRPARSIVKGLPKIARSEFVFTTTGKSPVSGWTRAKGQIDKLTELPPWTIHDLRRTVATGLQRLGIGLQVIEAVLNHTSGSRSGVVATYQTHAFGPEKAAALEAWGAHVIALVEGKKSAKVIAMRGAV